MAEAGTYPTIWPSSHAPQIALESVTQGARFRSTASKMLVSSKTLIAHTAPFAGRPTTAQPPPQSAQFGRSRGGQAPGRACCAAAVLPSPGARGFAANLE